MRISKLDVLPHIEAGGQNRFELPKTSRLPDFCDIRDRDAVLLAAELINANVATLSGGGLKSAADMPARQKNAFFTLCTPNYQFGLIGLYRSLRKHSNTTLFCLIDCEFDMSIGADFTNFHFVRVPRLKNASYTPSRREFSATLSKLWVFSITEFEKIAFLDCDTCVLRNIDDIFEKDTPAFAPDYVDKQRTQRFNSGVFLISPSVEGFAQLVDASVKAHSYDEGDQGLLNDFYAFKHFWLPKKYNTLRHHIYYTSNSAIDTREIAIIHYVVKKPWELNYRDGCDSFLCSIDDLWAENLDRSDLLKLISYWRKAVYLEYEGDISTFKRVKSYVRSYRLLFGATFVINSISVVLLLILFGRLSDGRKWYNNGHENIHRLHSDFPENEHNGNSAGDARISACRIRVWTRTPCYRRSRFGKKRWIGRLPP